MRLLLAPMEGLLDFVLRDVLTRVGGADRCVSEFIRITGTLLPDKVYLGIMPELRNGSKTLAGVPVRAQLLGSDPSSMAENAANLARLGPEGIDLNFGCPAKVVNRHGGGASLLQDPAQIARVVEAVRKAVPAPCWRVISSARRNWRWFSAARRPAWICCWCLTTAARLRRAPHFWKPCSRASPWCRRPTAAALATRRPKWSSACKPMARR